MYLPQHTHPHHASTATSHHCMHEEPGGNLFVSEAIYVIKELVELYITVKF